MAQMNWDLAGVPAYTDGDLRPELFCVGSGRADDAEGLTGEEGYMYVVEQTSAEAFTAYANALPDAGFTQEFAREDAYGIYRGYRKDGVRLYAYFIRSYGTARIITDRVSCSLDEFSMSSDAPKFPDTALMQFGMRYADDPAGGDTKGVLADCGMTYLWRTRSGKLIFVDGGEIEQCTPTAMQELVTRMHDLTGTAPGEKMTVALWICTHPHDDHMDMFRVLLEQYGGEINVERVMFNFPAASVVPPADYVRAMRRTLAKACPGALYLKPHTGMKLQMDSVEIEILLTAEDSLTLVGKVTPNKSSLMMRFSFEGSTAVLLADANDELGGHFSRYHEPAPIRCDYLQTAHHLINLDETIYSQIVTENVLIPESRYVLQHRHWDNYLNLATHFDRDKFYMAGDYTVVFKANGEKTETLFYPVVY